MKPEAAAITGGEDWAALSPDLRALSQFYRAFNQRTSIGDPELLRCYQEVLGYVSVSTRPQPWQR